MLVSEILVYVKGIVDGFEYGIGCLGRKGLRMGKDSFLTTSLSVYPVMAQATTWQTQRINTEMFMRVDV